MKLLHNIWDCKEIELKQRHFVLNIYIYIHISLQVPKTKTGSVCKVHCTFWVLISKDSL